MAIVRAVKSGNWSDTTVWNTGALPTSADDVYSNTFTVTIDVSPTVLSVQTGSATGVTAGGTFIPTNGITLTCTGTGLSPGTSFQVITSTLTSGQSCAIVATCRASSGNGFAVNHNGAGTVNIVGNCLPSFQSSVNNSGTGTINITGDCGNSAGGGSGVVNNSSGVVNITGNCFYNGASNASTGTINITGNCTAGANGSSVSNSSSGIVTIVGTLTPVNQYVAVTSASVTATNIFSGPFLTSNSGVNAFYVARWFWANSNVTPTYYQIRTANLATIRPLYTADSVGGNPAVSNVRSGTVYGPAGELTGTCAVPPAGSVALGVPVDNTTGTAYITANDIATALSSASAVTLNQQTSTLTTPGSIGERLKLASTVATTAQQLSDALSNE